MSDLVTIGNLSFRASLVIRIIHTRIYFSDGTNVSISGISSTEIAQAVSAALERLQAKGLDARILRLEQYTSAILDKINVLAEMHDELKKMKEERKGG